MCGPLGTAEVASTGMLGPSVTGEIGKQWTDECGGKLSGEAAQLEASGEGVTRGAPMPELRSPFWMEKITKGRVLLFKVTGLFSGQRPSFQPLSHDSEQGEFI